MESPAGDARRAAAALSRCRRVLIVGCGGAGKSTLARSLGPLLDLPVVHLDRHFWRSGWVRTPDDEWDAKLSELIEADAWLMDGSFSGSLEMRLGRSDGVILLDYPRGTCVRRVLWRVLSSPWTTRADMAEGCDEHFDLDYLRWIWRWRSNSRPKVLSRLDRASSRVEVVHLRSSREAAALVAELVAGTAVARRGAAGSR